VCVRAGLCTLGGGGGSVCVSCEIGSRLYLLNTGYYGRAARAFASVGALGRSPEDLDQLSPKVCIYSGRTHI
jgi:hypothetical protein